MNFYRHSHFALLPLLVAAAATSFAGSVVRVERGEDSCRLTFNGKPLFLYGGGGGGSKELLAAMGGNTFRTWGADHARKHEYLRGVAAYHRREPAHQLPGEIRAQRERSHACGIENPGM